MLIVQLAVTFGHLSLFLLTCLSRHVPPLTARFTKPPASWLPGHSPLAAKCHALERSGTIQRYDTQLSIERMVDRLESHAAGGLVKCAVGLTSTMVVLGENSAEAEATKLTNMINNNLIS